VGPVVKHSGLGPLVFFGLETDSNTTVVRDLADYGDHCTIWTYALSLLDLVDLELELVVLKLGVEREGVGVVHILSSRLLLQDPDPSASKRLKSSSELLGL
jgi:hypothetical protein